MRRWLKSTFVGVGALTLIGGCAKTPDAGSQVMWRQMARAYLVGVTYDQALIASRQENPRRLREKINSLEELHATDVAVGLQLSSAEERVRTGANLLMQAYHLKPRDPAQSQMLMGQAGGQFRSALRWSPNFPSRNPQLLNSIGYYLADNGHSAQDFERAEEFTTRAVAILEKAIQNRGRDAELLQALQQQQAITRDSQAWALYKLKRFNEAASVQEKALSQAKESQLDNLAFAELWMHHAKILQAQGKTDAANVAINESKKLEKAK